MHWKKQRVSHGKCERTKWTKVEAKKSFEAATWRNTKCNFRTMVVDGVRNWQSPSGAPSDVEETAMVWQRMLYHSIQKQTLRCRPKGKKSTASGTQLYDGLTCGTEIWLLSQTNWCKTRMHWEHSCTYILEPDCHHVLCANVIGSCTKSILSWTWCTVEAGWGDT